MTRQQASAAQKSPTEGRQFAAPLPDGASALSETWQDWVVACTVQDTVWRCVMTQTHTHSESGQRVLAIEIATPSQGAATDTLVLPFGLALDAGITLQIDDRPATRPLRLRTCLPAGCTVPLAFDPAILTALRVGSTLKVKAIAAADGSEVLLPISLQGLAPALDYLTTIAK